MFELQLELDRTGAVPLYMQIYRHFRALMEGGLLQPGEKLPSKRSLMASLGVSQTTVESALELLVAEGWAETRAKSGIRAAALWPAPHHGNPVSKPVERPAAALPWPLSTGAADTGVFPYAAWARLTRETLLRGPELLERGHRQGDWALRAALAEFLWESRGVRCRPEQILVGAGQEYLLHQLLRLLPPGAPIALEDPGYPTARQAALRAGLRPLPVPVDSRGIDPEALARTGAKAVYLTPAHQFPTGATLPQARRAAILDWAGSDKWIIEDDYDGDFRWQGRPRSALQAADRAGRVVYMTTFSRTIAPGFRLALLVLPEGLLERYEQLGDRACTVSRLEQEALRRFLAEGYYFRHLRRCGALYRKKQAALLEGLSALPGIQIGGAQAGLHITARLPGRTEGALVAKAAAAGVGITGMSRYRADGQGDGTVVIGFAGLSMEQLGEAVEKLVEAWRA